MHQKVVPDHFLILVSGKKHPFRARKYFKNVDILNEDYQKSLKKLNLFFLLNPVPFNGHCYKKEKRPGISDQCLFRLLNKSRKVPLLVIYYLTKFDI